MSASGFTPIQLFRTTTATAAPTALSLADGELAINLTDEKLYFKNAAGVVKLLASNAGSEGTVTSVAVSGGTTGLTTSGGPITSSGTITLGGTLAVANGGTGVTTSTGTGSVVLNTSPTLVTPALGTPSSATLTNATGLPIVAGTTGTLSVARGGTGATTFTANRLLRGDGTGALQLAGIFDQSSAEAVRIDSSGNVGIGLTSASERLDVNGNIRVRGNLGIFNPPPSDFWAINTINSGVFVGYGNFASQGSFGLDITANGYRNSSGTWTTLNTNGSTSAAQIRLQTGDGAIVFGSDAAKATGSSLSVTERMRITSAGNVGIGTTSPDSLLHLSANDPRITFRDTSGTSAATNYFQVGQAGANGEFCFLTADPNNVQPNTFMQFSVDGSERMRITSAGNVGIGTSAPNAAALLDVTSTTAGFLPPRMTTAQRDAITSPPNGLMLYNTTTDKLQVRAAGSWVDLH
jgi:hypothetical protein